jgi:ribose-phosphate pyrophosphokinase
MPSISLYIASDHAGFDLKNAISNLYKDRFNVIDFGTFSRDSCNYNEIAEKMLEKLQEVSQSSVSEVVNFGILICNTGTGMSIIANRFNKIRACHAIDLDHVKLARSHNNANVICIGDKKSDVNVTKEMIDAFIIEKFEGGRHINRLVFDAKKYINLSYRGNISSEYNEIKYKLKYFPCGEYEFSIQDNIVNQDIEIFQSFTLGKFNDDLMKLQVVCDVLKRNNVKSIKLISPFLPYTRQDRTYDTKSSLGSKLVADIVNNCGIAEIVTYDLHALQIEGFFNCKVQHLSMIPNFIADIKSRFKTENVIVFPDAGSASRFKRFFAEESFDIAIINKNRTENGIKMSILGNVRGKNAIIIDDMIDGGGTIIEASKLLLENNASEVNVYATHGIFSGDAVEKINNSSIKEVFVGMTLGVDLHGSKILSPFKI